MIPHIANPVGRNRLRAGLELALNQFGGGLGGRAPGQSAATGREYRWQAGLVRSLERATTSNSMAAASERQKPDTTESTGYVPGDDVGTRWRNWFAILTGKMNQKGQEQYVEARDLRNEEADCKRCEKQRDYLLQFSMRA